MYVFSTKDKTKVKFLNWIFLKSSFLEDHLKSLNVAELVSSNPFVKSLYAR